jgi:transposase-like protein
LSSEARAALVADYESGVSANQLAKQHQLSRCSIRRLLRESGIARRHLAMSEADVEQAVQLYTSGQTIAAVADQLGRPSSTVQTALSPGLS